MAEHAHLALKRLEGEMERRKPQGFGGNPQRDRGTHGPRIEGQIEQVLEDHKSAPSTEGVDPSLILRIELAGYVDEGEWERLGLIVLSEDADKTLLLFATDQELNEFRRRVEAYQGDLPPGQKNPSYAGLIEAIEAIGTAKADDRIGNSLKAMGLLQAADFADDQTYLVDVELFHPADDMQAEIFVMRLEKSLGAHGGVILNTYMGDHLLLCRVEANGAAIKSALEMPEVASVELPPRPDLQVGDIGDVTADDIDAGEPPPDNALAIGVIDSGVNFGHPLLAYAMKGTFSSHDQWSDADEAGHGTSVASMAAYGDVSARQEAGDFSAPFWLASARVVDARGEFPKEITVPEIMEKSIRRLHDEHGCRIFNVSLGDPKLEYDGGKAGIWAETLDLLARELDILFVISTGNRTDLTVSFGEKIIDEYPNYLLEPGSRLLDPATAALALTVGSVAHCNALEEEDADFVGVLPVCGLDQPSPFTRSGPGIRGMVKPDLVDYGGSAVWDGPTKSLVNGGSKSAAGVWTFHHEPVTQLFRARSGTSFSTPVVAHKAALVLSQFPGASANFLRAMLALTGEMPPATVDLLSPASKSAPLMVCGHGIANVDHALASDDSRVIFHTDDELPLDRFAVYELPIPPVFQTTKGMREIRVSLAFDPPVRRTRADYLGVTMGWRLLRGTNEQEVFDKFRRWEKAEGDPPELPKRYVCDTFPGPQLREKGALQCASFIAQRDMSSYGSKYYVAVWCRRRWAPKDIEKQRFSLAVQLRHSAEIELYQSLTLPLEIQV
ncbi:S8 family peptidase [Qipengyuania seohaensis]|uniref:S8 family peptidase n=1 Tax=Qipengyuania seohaensis TaxID=266951 RepID=UPI000C2221A3|nr:S8 family peptidase [Qipengyuania seohaensis]